MIWIECEYMQVQLFLFHKFESQFCIIGFYNNWEEPSGRAVSCAWVLKMSENSVVSGVCVCWVIFLFCSNYLF